MDSTIYSEILVLIDILFRDVLRNYLVRYIAGTTAEVSSGPHVPSPELLFNVRKLRHQVVRRLPFSHCSSRLMVTCGGIDTNRCTWSLATCPFMMFTSCCAQMSRIRSRTRVATSPRSAGRRDFVIHTRCKWISNTVCAPRR